MRNEIAFTPEERIEVYNKRRQEAMQQEAQMIAQIMQQNKQVNVNPKI